MLDGSPVPAGCWQLFAQHAARVHTILLAHALAGVLAAACAPQCLRSSVDNTEMRITCSLLGPCLCVTFPVQWCVGAQKTENFKTWDEITRLLGHQHRTLDVFKIDIEGHEPGVLAELRHDTPLPRQIVIELHMYATDRPTAIQKPAPRTPAQLSLLVMHMASLGYGVVGQEDNVCKYLACMGCSI